MGLGSFLKKSIKNAFRGGSAWGFVSKAAKPLEDQVRGALGLNAFADIAQSQQAALNQQAEAMKLQNANSAFQNVVQFEDGGTNMGASDIRRKKQASGGYSSGLGLNL